MNRKEEKLTLTPYTTWSLTKSYSQSIVEDLLECMQKKRLRLCRPSWKSTRGIAIKTICICHIIDDHRLLLLSVDNKAKQTRRYFFQSIVKEKPKNK